MNNPTVTAHRWNQDFVWRSVTGSPCALTSEQTDAFNKEGFFVIEDLLAIEAETEAALRSLEGERLSSAKQAPSPSPLIWLPAQTCCAA